MKNKFKTPLTLLLAFATCMTVASCTNESSSTDALSDNGTSSNEEATLAERSTSAITTAPAEDPVTDAIVTDAPVTDTPVTNEPATIPETEAPAKDTTKIPETKAPAEDTTKAPETEAPAEDTTAEVTTKPEEDTKAPATTAPGQDPNVDYSEWGKHGFENLLPIPLPFSDEEADWVSKKEDSVNYKVTNDKKIRLDDPDDFPRIFKEYVESYEAYGYMVTLEQYEFAAQYKRERLFDFSCGDGYIIINIYYRS